MCGFAVNADFRDRGRAVPWGLRFLRHRGPDGEGILDESNRGVVLEHVRLAVLDPENPASDQPFLDPTGRWAIVYNGEIFNFAELRLELQRRGVIFRTKSDTEVVLLGFIADGEKIFTRLRGMFAFVIWDRLTNEFFLARDQVGVKPAYYLLRDGFFAASSEVRPLLRHPRISPSLDPAAVAEYLAFGNTFGDNTLVNGVRKVPPGCFLHIRDGISTVHEYWSPLGEEATLSEDDARIDLRSLLDECVASALVSDVPVGLMLSGGLDSSSIATLAARHVDPSSLTSYSVAFGEPNDEAQVAQRLAKDLGLRHRVLRLSREAVNAEFEGWLAALDYPTANPTSIAVTFVARAARQDGLKVLLSGDGGDELFGGYRRWMKYLRFHDQVWRNTPLPLRRTVGRAAAAAFGGLAGDIGRRAASGGDLFVPSRPLHDDLLSACLTKDAWAANPVAQSPELVLNGLRKQFVAARGDGDYLSWMSFVTLRTSLVEDYLQRLDKMGMRYGVEGRVPLLDPHLVRWALALPQELKVGRFQGKALFRSAVSEWLPRYITERPKQGFCPPTAQWAESLMASRLGRIDGSLVEDGILNPDAGAKVLAAGRAGSFAAWTLGALVEWTERNVDSPTDVLERSAA